MFLIETNKLKRLLHLSFVGKVRAGELQPGLDELASLLAELPPGFHLLTNLSHLESMELACHAEISRVMELCHRRGMASVIRVIPKPEKDIGFNILSAFHYQHGLPVSVCSSLEEAIRLLG